MGYVFACMVIGFFVGGIGLFVQGVGRIVRRWLARDRLRQAQGTVVQVHREIQLEKNSSMRRKAGAHYANYPVIEFRSPGAQTVQFRSETGDRGTPSRFIVGQRIAVVYDPDGSIAPLIDSWYGIWSDPLSRMVGGVVFVGCALLISNLFYDRFLATTFLGSLYAMLQDPAMLDR